MPDKYSNNELYQIMKSIKEQLKDGFKGIHERQDKTNGNVASNTKFRITIESQFKVWKWLAAFIGLQGFVVMILFILGLRQ